MGNVHEFNKHYRSSYGAMSTSLGGETSDTITTPIFAHMQNYDLVRAMAQVSNVVATHVITLKMWEATASGGGGSATLTHSLSSDVYTSTQVTDLDILEAQVRGEEMSAGFEYAGAKLTTDDADGTECASLHLVQGRARYKQATLPT